VGEDIGPIVPLVPRDLRGGVYFDGHHLAYGSALDQNYRRANSACASAALFAALDVCCYQWVARGDVCAGNDVCVFDGESAEGDKDKR
jgi:hypothetical protein